MEILDVEEAPRPIPETFKTNGLEYRAVKRNGMLAMYSVGSAGKLRGFEVVRIVVAKAGQMFGEPQPEREVYPGNEAFGRVGWYFQAREDAETCFDSLLEALS